MTIIAVTREDDGVSICNIIGDGHTDEQVVAEISRHLKGYSGWRRIDAAEIPKDRTFRDALRDTGKLTHDVERAREVCHTKRREARAAKLAPLDNKAVAALANPAALAAAETERQSVRDENAAIQTQIDAAVTVADLSDLVAAFHQG